MANMDAGAMADTAVRLGLLSIHHADEAWMELMSRKVPAEDFLRFMEHKGYLTPFQTGKLLKGDFAVDLRPYFINSSGTLLAPNTLFVTPIRGEYIGEPHRIELPHPK